MRRCVTLFGDYDGFIANCANLDVMFILYYLKETAAEQDDDRAYHEVQVTLAEDSDEHSRSLLDLSVNAKWNETAVELDESDAITDGSRVVSDAEQRLVTAFIDDRCDHQLDLAHVQRTLNYKLWDDGALSLDDRKEIISEVAGELFPLKNSVAKYQPEGDRSAIRYRIARAKERIEKAAWQLEQLSSPSVQPRYVPSGPHSTSVRPAVFAAQAALFTHPG